MGKSFNLLNHMKNGKALKGAECLNGETEEENGFVEEESEIGGEKVSQFTFNDGTSEATDTKITDSPKSTVDNSTTTNTRKTPKGITPPINGEPFNIKRSYQFRESTVRMLNELKANHPDVNVYLNTIVDAAIRHYHDYIINQGNVQK